MLNRALKLIRVFHDLKQKDLAERLEISRSHLSEVESGKKRPSTELLEKYSKEFDLPMSNLYFFSEHLENKVDLEKIRYAVVSKVLSMMELSRNVREAE